MGRARRRDEAQVKLKNDANKRRLKSLHAIVGRAVEQNPHWNAEFMMWMSRAAALGHLGPRAERAKTSIAAIPSMKLCQLEDAEPHTAVVTRTMVHCPL